jgi:tripeptide aminopeptidase
MSSRSQQRKGKSPTIDEQAAINRVTELMAIPGQSGEEKTATEWIRKHLLAAGAKKGQICYDTAQKKSPAGGNCGNLILKLPGTFKAPRRLFSAHSDTVPLCVGAKPVRKGRMMAAAGKTALGADDRAGCAILLTSAVEILTRKLPHPPLTFLWSIQEETGMYGIRGAAWSKLGNPTMAFNYDGGKANTLVTGATGAYSMVITIEGKASHAGGSPEKGVSAAEVFGLAMADLRKGGWHGLIMKGGQRGSSNVGVIRGGAATNVVLDRLVIRAEARAHNKSLRRRILEAYFRAFARAAKTVRNTDSDCAAIEFEAEAKYEAFKLPKSDPSVVAAAEAIKALRMEPSYSISNGGLDANWLTARGIPAVTLGAGIRNAHTINEQLAIAEYIKSCRLTLLLAAPEKSTT